MRDLTERWTCSPIADAEVRALLRRAFPDRAFSLEDLGKRYGCPVVAVGNLNGPEAQTALRQSGADLGVVLGTRILKRSTFGIPAMGSVNLHKGAVPEYRGMPPGFWELYDGADSASVTVHFVDDGLDTGDVLETATVAIHAKETPESLQAKLNIAGSSALASAVASLRDGTAQSRKQPPATNAARTRPTRQQTNQLASKLPYWHRPDPVRRIFKNLAYLGAYWTGIWALRRTWHSLQGDRAAILLYHRVNDVSRDALTHSTWRFAQHVLTIQKFYRPVATASIVDHLGAGQSNPATSVAIHFDDCYRDVHTEAGAILKAAGIPGTFFISSGFIETDRAFAHDAAKYPHAFENLRRHEVREWLGNGNEIGAHTVNHADLGAVALEDARYEVVQSRADLERIAGQPVLFFSFPFGRPENFREEVRGEIDRAGYRALFSAFGGFVGRGTRLLDIPRMGTTEEHSPLYLMMELEGMTPSAMRLD